MLGCAQYACGWPDSLSADGEHQPSCKLSQHVLVGHRVNKKHVAWLLMKLSCLQVGPHWRLAYMQGTKQMAVPALFFRLC